MNPIRAILIFSFQISFLAYSWGQSTQLIKGVVIDAMSGSGLPSALVTTDTDTAVTSSNGEFVIPVLENEFRITVQYLGYEKQAVKVSPTARVIIRMQPSTLALHEVIVTAGLEPMAGKYIAGNISPITRQMIQRDDPFQISQSLNRVPGLYMHSGTYSTSRITLRGIGSRDLFGTSKVKAYFEGIPLNDGSGNLTIEDIDQALIGGMEVIKGPNASRFGAGLAGTILMSAYTPQQEGTSLQTHFTAGEYNTRRWMNRVSHQSASHQMNVLYSKMSSDGWRQNSAYDREQVGINGRVNINETGSLGYLMVYTDLKAYIPSAINEEDYLQEPQKAAFTWNQARGFESYQKSLMGVNLRQGIGKSWKINATVFGGFREAYEPRPFNILSENTVTVGTRSFVRFEQGAVSIHAGTEIIKDQYQWETYENLYDNQSDGSVRGAVINILEEERDYINLFAEMSWQVNDALKLVTGLNYNTTDYDLEDRSFMDNDQSGRYTFDPVLSPRLGLTYALKPAQHLFANISHGFSPPGLDETLYPDGSINPNIRPEMGWNLETGLRGGSARLSYDITLYHMIIDDLLVAQRTAEDAFVGVNAGLNHHSGLDAFASYAIPLSQEYTLNIFGSGAWMHYRFIDFENEGQVYDGNQLTGVPEWTLNPGVELLSEKGFYGNINGHLVGAIPMDDANSKFADAYQVWRLKAGYRIHKGGFQLDGYLGINNIFNEQYAAMLLINATGFGGAAPRYYYPGQPANLFGGLSIAYQL